MIKPIVATLLLLCIASAPLAAAEDDKHPIEPIAPSDLEWHKQLLARAKRGNMNVVFFGDSATVNWEKAGSEIWKQKMLPLGAANFGVNSNQVGHLLWRLKNGQLEGYQAKVIVLAIGHADIYLAQHTASEIGTGIMACVQEIRQRQPNATVFVMALASASPGWKEKQRETGVGVNELLAKQCDGKKVRLIDGNAKALEQMEEIQKELAIVKDVHLLTIRYKLWAEVLDEPLKEVLGTRATSP